LAATRSQITRRDDDRELQTEQTIVGLPARKLQPPASSATAARSVFGASRQLPDRLGEGPLTDTWACRWELVKMPHFGHWSTPAWLFQEGGNRIFSLAAFGSAAKPLY
jgi:hypothetical protein